MTYLMNLFFGLEKRIEKLEKKSEKTIHKQEEMKIKFKCPFCKTEHVLNKSNFNTYFFESEENDCVFGWAYFPSEKIAISTIKKVQQTFKEK